MRTVDSVIVIALICMATPVMAEPAPFVITGHVYDFCGDPCNGSYLQVTNLNTGEDWNVRNSSASNYYRLVLSGDCVSTGDVLRFDASGCSQSRTVTHPVTSDEITAGGFVENITLEPAAGPDLTVTAIKMPDHIYCGRETMIYAAIENIGTVDAGTFDLRLEVDGTVVDTVSTVLPLETCVAGTDVAFKWTPASAGTFNLTATADPGNAISESCETNNMLSETVQVTSSETIHVPGNYPTIQDAINASSAGTRIIVSQKSDTDNVYYEHINVTRDGIWLIADGEVVIRNDTGDQITVWGEGCTVQGFEIRDDAGAFSYPNYPGVGVRLCSDYNIVRDSHIHHTAGGIQIEDSSYNLIENNTIGPGILLVMGILGDHSIITGNTFGSDTGNGWRLGGDMYSWDKPASHNIVSGNTFAGSTSLKGSDNLIYNNRFLGYAEMGSENTYNITKTLRINIIGGPYLGGNYWSGYAGVDEDGDGLGDTSLPYNGDYHPLVPNTPPDKPDDPLPSDGATGVSTNADLSWTGGDPDAGDSVTYDVYFEKEDSNPDLVSSNQQGTTYDPGTLSYSSTYYWKIVARDEHGSTNSSVVWSFTTESEPYTPPPNNPPTASFTFSPEYPFAGCNITFDGSGSSDPDGTIVNYEWDFGDGNTSTGVTANYSYSSAGTYAVQLKVTDNGGRTGTRTIDVQYRADPIRGDVNLDGEITTADAVIVLKIADGSRLFDDAADVSGDGRVTSLDALMILQAASGAIEIA